MASAVSPEPDAAATTGSGSDLTSSSSLGEEEEEQWASEPEWTDETGTGGTGAAGRGRGDTASLSSDGRSSDSSEAEDWQDRAGSPDLPPEYWQVQKLVKYIKAGNPTATLISLCALRDLDLDDKWVQLSIKDSGGLQVLLNILDTEETWCKIASLLIIRKITVNKHIRKTVFNMRGLDSLIYCLSDYSKQLKLMSAETIANICQIKKARRIMRSTNGIARLVDMLAIEKPQPAHKYYTPYVMAEDEGLLEWEVQRCAGIALWAIAKSTKNREAILRAGAVPLLARLLKTKQDKVVIPVVGVLQECASEPIFREAIYAEGLLDDFISGLQSPTFELVQYSARAIHMCAHDEKAREVLFRLGAIDKLITIIQNESCRENKDLLAAGTGAIWKCASVICKSEKYFANGLVELLVSFLEADQPLEVLINTTGALEEIVKLNPISASIVQKVGGITPIVKLLSMGQTELLMNTTRSIGILARDPECRDEMESQEAFRMIWSLLKHSSPQVQSSAAYAICPYVRSSRHSAEMVRNYVGGLEVIVELVVTPNILLQAAMCETVAAIATSPENLSIMTDHGIVQYLSAICCRTWEHDALRRSLAKAIGECCKLEGNSRVFGELKAVAPLCTYLTSKEPRVVREAAKALAALSEDPRNCVTMHQCGVVPHLLRLIGSADEQLHEAAAVVMSSIRHLALTTETIRLLQ